MKPQKDTEIAIYKSICETCYQNLDEAIIAVVILLKLGTHNPGSMYSLMNSELLLYSS